VTGIDACPGGWVAVTLAASGPPVVTVAPTLEALGIPGPAGIDMPLGLLASGWRAADALARRALGRRGPTVFAIAPRPVWAEPTYAEANRRCRELTGQGLSAQAWGLRARLLDADRYRRTCRHPLHEVHPELAFAALAGAPLPDSKHTPAGRASRRGLLAAAGIDVLQSTRPTATPRPTASPSPPASPRPPTNPRPTRPAEHDLLDAAAVAWSAQRIAAGTAVILTDPAQRADDDTEIAIRY
jgi:predicted RNase H-like nuclease